MDYSGTITTHNVMAVWGDGGKNEGKDEDSLKKPPRLTVRMRFVIVTREEGRR